MRSHLNPYEILGISPAASDAEIKKAYRQQSLRYHPDKNPGSEARFKDILHAYEMLIKPENFTHYPVYPHAGDSDDQSIIPYQADKLTHDSVPLLANEEAGVIEDLNTYFDDMNEILLKFKNRYDSSFDDVNKIGLWLDNPYDSSHLENLDENQIKAIIWAAEEKYKNIPELVTENAFLWKAEKPGCAPIYLFSTMHFKLNADFKARFDDIFDHVIDQVEIVFTETEMPLDLGIMDCYIANKAHEQGRQLKPLENDLVINATVPDGFDSMRQYVKETFPKRDASNESAKPDEYKDDEKMYLTYITDPLSVLDDKNINEKNEYKDLLVSGIKRNFIWMQVNILPTSSQQQKSSGIFDGAIHNSGRYGLPNLLANEGYTVTPLIKEAPVAKSTVVRNLVFGEGNTLFKRVVENQAAKQANSNERQLALKAQPNIR